MTDLDIPRKLWENPHLEQTQMWKFKQTVERNFNRSFPDYESLYQWSCQKRSDFWIQAFNFFPIVYTGRIPEPCVDESARMDSIPKWFPGVKLNFAENILYTGTSSGQRTTSPGKEDNKIAITEVREGSFNEPIRNLTWGELRQRVAQLSNAMRARGVQKGDRIALVASTSIDTLTVFLATTAIGALFSSSSTDMGTKGILDRLLQIKPKYLFMDDAAIYNGKYVDLRPKIAEVVAGMKSVSEFIGVVTQTRFPDKGPIDISSVPSTETWPTFVSSSTSTDLIFEQCAFSDPFIIVYSSGTTGQPKCIVHSVGGVVLNGHKEGRLHRDIDHASTQLQYTTTGWIMYLGSVQALLMGARMICYDGSPFLPKATSFIKLLAQEKVTHLGTSPRYLQTLQTSNIAPKQVADLSALKVVTCTGMVLSNALFEWFYDVGFPPSAQLDNISGGTDLAGAWGTGNPILPVYVGGCQCLSLGMPVAVYDSTIEPTEEELRSGKPIKGKPVAHEGEPGDLCGTGAFPTMPLYFFGDDTDGSKYFNSYFGKYDNVWTHGDFIQIHPVTKQVIFLGRADGVLNPSGVRFGSSEIYSVIEKHFHTSISDTICVGQRRPQDTDERVLLFVLMKPGHTFTKSLTNQIKARIGDELSKRHVPKFVFPTPEIPTTVNGKKVELPVKQIVCGKKIRPSGTLANPGSLEYYYRFAEDENLVEIGQDQVKAKL
ncbi:hypothetical protein H2198_007737 [Neophaeococcomyces mojaviensis]|uniref:Uncharacterized protein n=1 Tax=Neophaeococcomyces mojaviensis TaxID=3383035 RepID=A0ACC2ZZS9_9EURO|nr:hypothetical protein H2198_007737 [Knufia sp. JES_112]